MQIDNIVDSEVTLAQEAVMLAERGSSEAVERCNQVKGLNSKNPEVWTILCSAYRRIGKFDQALFSGQKAVELDSNYSNGWYAFGRAYEEASDFQKAKTMFKNALRVRPDYKKAQVALNRVSSEEVK